MTKAFPKGGGAVTAQRKEPKDSLDDFPTPPWGTRAIVKNVMPHLAASTAMPFKNLSDCSVWEPTGNRGLMAETLKESFGTVYASDIKDYGVGYDQGYFVEDPKLPVSLFGVPQAECPFPPDWLFFNPPFKLGERFIIHALKRAVIGVVAVVRLAFLEGVNRYEAFFRDRPPNIVAPFVERLPMHKGRWEPDGDTTTAYVVLVWFKPDPERYPTFWIPPGQRKALTHPTDRERFAPQTMPPDDGGLFGWLKSVAGR